MDHYEELIGDCLWTDCGTTNCPLDRATLITSKYDPSCGWSGFCCKDPAPLDGPCSWHGDPSPGSCDGNSGNWCTETEVQILSDQFGDLDHGCADMRMNRSFCCPVPANEDFFLPIESDNQFPEHPHDDSEMLYEFRFLDGQPDDADPSGATKFGSIFIQGNVTLVSSLVTKRDGTASGLHFLDCKNVDKHIKARFVCTSEDDLTDCYEMLEGGLEGTILELPPHCKGENYAVAHSMIVAPDQSLPSDLKHIKNNTVMELTMSYDISLAKRDAGDAFFRLDYSNSPHYWENAARYGTAHTPDSWSSALTGWVRSLTDTDGDSLHQDFGKQLISVNAECPDETNFASVSLSGGMAANLQVAVSVTGKINAGGALLINEAYSAIRSSVGVNLTSDSFVLGKLQVEKTGFNLIEEVWGTDFIGRLLPFRVRPYMQLSGAYSADVDMIGNWTTSWIADTSDRIVQSWPDTAVSTAGETRHLPVSGGFSGFVEAIGSDPLSKRDNYAGYTFIRVSPVVGVQLEMHNPTNPFINMIAMEANIYSTASTMSISSDGSWAVDLNTSGVTPFRGYIESEFMLPLDGAADEPPTGKGAGAMQLFGGIAKAGNGPGPSSSTVLDSIASLVSGSQVVLACFKTGSGPSCPQDHTCSYDHCSSQGYCKSDDDPLTLLPRIHIKASRRRYDVKFNDQQYFDMNARSYPSIGDLYGAGRWDKVLAMKFDYLSPDCRADPAIVDFPITLAEVNTPGGAWKKGLITEHILELQTHKMFLEAAVSGKLTTGRKLPTTQRLDVNAVMRFWNHDSLTNAPYLGPVVDGNPDRFAKPADRVFEALGSTFNSYNLVAANGAMNSAKGRVWSLKTDPFDAEDHKKLVYSWVHCRNKATEFMAQLRTTRAIFDYLNENNEIRERLWNTASTVKTQLDIIEKELPLLKNLSSLGVIFLDTMLDEMAVRSREWYDERIDDALNIIQAERQTNQKLPSDADEIEDELRILRDMKGGIKIDARP